MHSRNRRAGILMGQGKTMEEAMQEVNMVVEGVYSAKAAMELAKEILGGKYEFVLTTHIDKGHIHNHLIALHLFRPL